MSRASARRRRVVAVLCVAALLGACRDGAGDTTSGTTGGAAGSVTVAPTEPPTSTPASTTSTGLATSQPGATASTGSTASTGTTGSTAGTGGTGSTASTATGAAAGFLEPAGTTARSFPGTNRMAVLTAVRTGRQDGFDRVVFEFQPGDELPGYLVGYQDLPLRADPSDEPLSIRGEVALLVRMQAASRFRFEDATLVYRGPSTVTVDGTAVTEVVLRGDFEALLSWAIGSTGRRPYRVGTLDGPPRIYVDIAT